MHIYLESWISVIPFMESLQRERKTMKQSFSRMWANWTWGPRDADSELDMVKVSAILGVAEDASLTLELMLSDLSGLYKIS